MKTTKNFQGMLNLDDKNKDKTVNRSAILRRTLINGSEQESLTQIGKLGLHDYQTLKIA